jgi:hypothetical protein
MWPNSSGDSILVGLQLLVPFKLLIWWQCGLGGCFLLSRGSGASPALVVDGKMDMKL